MEARQFIFIYYLSLSLSCFQEYEGTKLDSSAIPSEDVQNYSARSRVSARRTRFHRLPRKHMKLLNEEIGVSRRAYGSLVVSNASELFKLVFLSTSTAPQVPNLLAETLRRYSEHDLFAAFDYLREKKIMVSFASLVIGFTAVSPSLS